jgi:Mrp family chromosome partitioning ATPase
MIVSKAVNMTRMMNVPLYGFVENYSYLTCPDCGKRIEVFGKSKLDEIALSYSLPILARLPIDPKLAELLDEGKLEDADVSAILPAAELITKAK